MTEHRECWNCGFPVDLAKVTVCPKCGEDVRLEATGQVVDIDVAHDGETVPEALRKVEAALDRALVGDARGLKVIHGHGSSGRRGAIGPAVKTWLRAEAERYAWKVVTDKYNPGATIVWFEARHGSSASNSQSGGAGTKR
jgi:hypothetical protein